MGHQTSGRRLRRDAAAVRSGRTVLHIAVSRCQWVSPRGSERRSVAQQEREYPAIFVLEDALRTAAGTVGAIEKGNCRRAFPAVDDIGNSTRERVLRARRDA